MPLNTLLAQYLPAIEAEMRASLDFDAGPHDSYLEMLHYHLGWIDDGQGPVTAAGKRLRPALALLVCAASGGEWQQALPAAAAVELFHNFTLIHDDIQDDSPTRRGRPTVWKLWGAPQAINAGDALFTYARRALHRLEAHFPPAVVLDAMHVFDAASLRVTRGQYLDMRFESLPTVPTGEYLEMIAGKTAALIGACAELGAVCAGAPDGRRSCYRDFGGALGMAFQIQDDWLGIWGDPLATGKSAATDIATRKKTLPVLSGLEHSERLRRLYADPAPLPVAEVMSELETCGAREFAEAHVRTWSDQALAALASAAPEGEAGEGLKELVQVLVGRRA